MGFSMKTVNTSKVSLLACTVLCFIFILLVNQSYAQESPSRLSKENIEKPISSAVQTTESSSNSLTADQIKEKIELINTHLLAIESKRKWINEDPTRIEEALENDWFNQMISIEKGLIMERDELLNLSNKR